MLELEIASESFHIHAHISLNLGFHLQNDVILVTMPHVMPNLKIFLVDQQPFKWLSNLFGMRPIHQFHFKFSKSHQRVKGQRIDLMSVVVLDVQFS